MNYKFETHEAYLDWCEDIVTKIYYAQIAMNDESIREAVHEVGMKLWITEGCTLIKEDYPDDDS